MQSTPPHQPWNGRISWSVLTLWRTLASHLLLQGASLQRLLDVSSSPLLTEVPGISETNGKCPLSCLTTCPPTTACCPTCHVPSPAQEELL